MYNEEIFGTIFLFAGGVIFEGNIETEHEKMFTEQGIKIKALIAHLDEGQRQEV